MQECSPNSVPSTSTEATDILSDCEVSGWKHPKRHVSHHDSHTHIHTYTHTHIHTYTHTHIHTHTHTHTHTICYFPTRRTTGKTKSGCLLVQSTPPFNSRPSFRSERSAELIRRGGQLGQNQRSTEITQGKEFCFHFSVAIQHSFAKLHKR